MVDKNTAQHVPVSRFSFTFSFVVREPKAGPGLERSPKERDVLCFSSFVAVLDMHVPVFHCSFTFSVVRLQARLLSVGAHIHGELFESLSSLAT